MSRWVIFDLDGTLSCTEKFMIPAIQDAMKQQGLPVWEADEVRLTIGERVEETNQKLFGQEHCARADRFWKCVEELQNLVYVRDMEAYEGVSELLDRLHERGYRTAVCSNAGSDYIEEVLEKLCLSNKIDRIRPVIPGKEKTESLRVFLEEVKPDFAIMVGDRKYDIAAAEANHILSVGCTYGCGGREELEPADYRIDEPLKLLDILADVGK